MAPSKILLLQETKIEEESILLIGNNKWKLNAGKAVSERGASGSLETLWCVENFLLKRWFATQHGIFTELYHFFSKISLALFNIYVLVNYIEKKIVGNRYQSF